eukprot:15428790-Alexandrium_andersonii.AAC.1
MEQVDSLVKDLDELSTNIYRLTAGPEFETDEVVTCSPLFPRSQLCVCPMLLCAATCWAPPLSGVRQAELLQTPQPKGAAPLRKLFMLVWLGLPSSSHGRRLLGDRP